MIPTGDSPKLPDPKNVYSVTPLHYRTGPEWGQRGARGGPEGACTTVRSFQPARELSTPQASFHSFVEDCLNKVDREFVV